MPITQEIGLRTQRSVRPGSGLSLSVLGNLLFIFLFIIYRITDQSVVQVTANFYGVSIITCLDSDSVFA